MTASRPVLRTGSCSRQHRALSAGPPRSCYDIPGTVLRVPLVAYGYIVERLRHVPIHVMARGQGYLAACTGMVSSAASITSGMIFARYGQGVYYLMAAMALLGGLIMWLSRRRLISLSSQADAGSR